MLRTRGQVVALYGTVSGCSFRVGDAVRRAHGRPNDRGTVYVHWPFCSQLCTYCNFNKYVRSHVQHEEMTQCLTRELGTLIRLSGIKEVTSVYFGGGTPSLARSGMVEAVMNEVVKYAHLPSGAEVTLEANPTSTEAQALRDFKLAGVNRLSLGVQCLSDRDLKVLNRDHTTSDAIRALQEASEVFLGRTNVDVMFGRPDQTLNSWDTELQKILELCDDHVSLYQLTIEHGTALARSVQRGDLSLPEPDLVAAMYERAVEVLESAGLERYEVSNFAKPGFQSQHNSSYWKGENYIGIGPGAHSRFGLPQTVNRSDNQFAATINTLEPNAWMKRVTLKGHGIQKLTPMTSFQRLEEVVASSMRTADGLTQEVWESFQPLESLHQVFSPTGNHWLDQLYQCGKLAIDNRGLRATRDGIMVVDSILPHLLRAMAAGNTGCRS